VRIVALNRLVSFMPVGVTHRFNELNSTGPEVKYVCGRRNPAVLISLCSTV